MAELPFFSSWLWHYKNQKPPWHIPPLNLPVSLFAFWEIVEHWRKWFLVTVGYLWLLIPCLCWTISNLLNNNSIKKRFHLLRAWTVHTPKVFNVCSFFFRLLKHYEILDLYQLYAVLKCVWLLFLVFLCLSILIHCSRFVQRHSYI